MSFNLYNFIFIIFEVYIILIVIRAFSSWLRPSLNNPIFRFLYDMTEPVLGLFRKLIPIGRNSGIDFSPIFAIICLQIIESILIRIVFY
ncbi:MAG: YggT family protein [Bacillota bacterium]